MINTEVDWLGVVGKEGVRKPLMLDLQKIQSYLGDPHKLAEISLGVLIQLEHFRIKMTSSVLVISPEGSN
jgi:hypothetical protein